MIKCDVVFLHASLRFIYIEQKQKQTRKRISSFIFAAAQYKREIGFSVNPSGSDVTFGVFSEIMNTQCFIFSVPLAE